MRIRVDKTLTELRVLSTVVLPQFREDQANRLILKHLRQRGLMAAFEALQRSSPTDPVGSITSPLNPTSGANQLEHPILTQLHGCLVKQGNFDAAESLLSSIAYPSSSSSTEVHAEADVLMSSTIYPTFPAPSYHDTTSSAEVARPSLFDQYCNTQNPAVQWTRLDTLQETSSWEGSAPSARGGHQMVLVRQRAAPSENTRSPGHHHEGMETSIGDESGSEGAGAALYLFGGWDGTQELSDFWKYDLQKGRWELLSRDTGSPDPGDHPYATAHGLSNPHDAAAHIGPGSRSCHQMAVDDSTGDIYLFGRFVDGQKDTSSSRVPTPSQIEGESTAPSNNTSATGGPGRGTQGRRAVNATPMPTVVISSPQLRGDAPDTQMSGAGNATPDRQSLAGRIPFNEDTSSYKPDLWVYHTRGEQAGTWEKLSSDTEVNHTRAVLSACRDARTV